ncbi:MAG: gliding motility-associated C-terminal domain-containing protein [Parafilimonas sp.]
MPILKAHAGNDTAVVINQPLQLNATGGVRYEWQPPASLSNVGISNPVALYTMPDEGIHYTVFVYNEAGCVDTASLTVKVYATSPTVFVPTGFTPNGDGRNDILKPIAAGMQRVELFNVYNRWGQLVFRTSVNGKGWDGTVNGKQQGAGTFVWMVKAVDYTGKPYMKKGTVVLIR